MFDWAKYLGLAEELAGRGDEAALRSAISRAYYAAFGVTASHLRGRGVVVPVFKTHAFAWRAFTNNRDPLHVEIGLQLDRLRQWREAADYDANYVGTLHEDARAAIGGARLVLDAIERLPLAD